MRADRILFLILSLIFLASCGGSGGGGGSDREETTTGGTEGGSTGGTTTGGTTTGGTTTGGSVNFDVTLDSALTASERSAVNGSINLLETIRIDGSKTDGFSEVFGGNSESNVVSYMENRVNYVVSEFTDHNSRILVPSSPALRKLQVYASNSSVLFWYIDQYFSQGGGAKYVISNVPREINSSRIGIIQLGDIFGSSDTITQAITLVHEARHSDCPDGALASDIVNFVEHGFSPLNKSCGQLHGSCGGNSCDQFAWGPYAIDYIYSISIVNGCTSCSFTEKQQAQINANMVQDAAFDIEGTMNGSHGRPDMSNSTQVRDDL